MRRRFQRLEATAAILVMAALAGCAVNEAQMPSADAGQFCVDDSMQCVARRQAALKTLMSDPARGWVRQPATPHAYAAGVRLFAFRGKKRELSCDELNWARKEAEAGPSVLKGASGITPAQASRGAMLATEVSRELAQEHARRCRKA